MGFSYSGPSTTETRKSCLVCMEWAIQGLLLLLVCVKIKSNKYFMDCYRNLVNILSFLYSLTSGYRVRDFFCFARLASIPILTYSFSYDIRETHLCLHDIWGETLEMCPRSFFSHEHKVRTDVPDDLPSSTPLAPEVGCLAGVQWGTSSSRSTGTRNPLTAVGAVVVFPQLRTQNILSHFDTFLRVE